MQQAANQLDLARAAGVSVSTVSRALSNSPGISVGLRSRIQKLAEELGYKGRASSAAASKTIRTYVTVNAATGGLAAFYGGVVEGLVAAAEAAGMPIEVRLVPDVSLDIARLERDASSGETSATLLVGIDATPEVLAQFGPDNQVILVNTLDPLMRFDCVAPNNFYGALAATRRLTAAGHRSLLHVRDHLRWTTMQRHRGFTLAVEETPGAVGAILDTRPNAEAALAAAVADRRAGKTDWTGIFCVHDMAAIQVIHALEHAGFRVPGDISVVGFDDLPAASMMTPRLSTMKVDCEAMGREAVGLVLRRRDDPDACIVQIECAVTPVPGGTISQIAAR